MSAVAWSPERGWHDGPPAEVRLDERGRVTSDVAIEWRVTAARAALRLEEGDGWLTKAARDLVRISAFAGFDPAEVMRRVAMTTDPTRTANAASVERVLGELLEEWDTRNA